MPEQSLFYNGATPVMDMVVDDMVEQFRLSSRRLRSSVNGALARTEYAISSLYLVPNKREVVVYLSKGSPDAWQRRGYDAKQALEEIAALDLPGSWPFDEISARLRYLPSAERERPLAKEDGRRDAVCGGLVDRIREELPIDYEVHVTMGQTHPVLTARVRWEWNGLAEHERQQRLNSIVTSKRLPKRYAHDGVNYRVLYVVNDDTKGYGRGMKRGVGPIRFFSKYR